VTAAPWSSTTCHSTSTGSSRRRKLKLLEHRFSTKLGFRCKWSQPLAWIYTP
jgi:hypothetical protein